jgi:hypothetical protein
MLLSWAPAVTFTGTLAPTPTGNAQMINVSEYTSGCRWNQLDAPGHTHTQMPPHLTEDVAGRADGDHPGSAEVCAR